MHNLDISELAKTIAVIENFTAHNDGIMAVYKALLEIKTTAEQDGRKTIQLMDRNAYVSTVVWSMDDLKYALEDQSVPVTEQNLTLLAGHVRGDLADASKGNEIIQAAVEEIIREDGFEKEENT